MLAGVLITNGGPHSADKWADITVDQIVQVSPTASAEMRMEANVLRVNLKAVVSQLHASVMSGERTLLDADGDGRLGSPLDPTELREDAVAAVVNAAKDTAWAEHFAKPDVQEYLGRLLMQHFCSIMDIERSWHADRHPDSDAAKAYKQARDTHGAQHVHLHIDHYRNKPDGKKPKGK